VGSNKEKKTSDKIPNDISIRLSKKELDLIFKWYGKGFTNIEEDRPLLDKLQKIYHEVFHV
jgi:hypothetical protein